MKALIAGLGLLVVLVAAFLLYRSPTAPPEMTEAERAQMEAGVRGEIADRFDRYRDALLNRDMGAFMSMYTADAQVFWPGMNLDKTELQAAMAEMFQSWTWTRYDVDLEDLFVQPSIRSLRASRRKGRNRDRRTGIASPAGRRRTVSGGLTGMSVA